MEPPKIKSATVSIVSPTICHEVIGPVAMILVFCHKGGVICISEVIDISPGDLNSNCVSSSPAFLMMYSAYKLNKKGDNIQP